MVGQGEMGRDRVRLGGWKDTGGASKQRRANVTQKPVADTIHSVFTSLSFSSRSSASSLLRTSAVTSATTNTTRKRARPIRTPTKLKTQTQQNRDLQRDVSSSRGACPVGM